MMLENMIDLWAKKSSDETVYKYCQINKKHILSIDFEDDIQINLVNGVTYFAFYDVFMSMDSLGLVGDDLDIISFESGFKKQNPDFDIVQYRKEKSEIENRHRAVHG